MGSQDPSHCKLNGFIPYCYLKKKKYPNVILSQ